MAKQATLADALAQHKKASEERERKQALLKVAASWVRARKSGDVELVKAASANLAAAITKVTMDKQAAAGAQLRKNAGRAAGAARKKQRTKAAQVAAAPAAATAAPAAVAAAPAAAKAPSRSLLAQLLGGIRGVGEKTLGKTLGGSLLSTGGRAAAALGQGVQNLPEKILR